MSHTHLWLICFLNTYFQDLVWCQSSYSSQIDHFYFHFSWWGILIPFTLGWWLYISMILIFQWMNIYCLKCVLHPVLICRSQSFMELVKNTPSLHESFWIISIGCILIFEYLYFLLQCNKNPGPALELAVNTYQHSGIQATVINSLQTVIQQHGDDHDTLCKVIIDIIVNNQMCMLFFYKFLKCIVMHTSTEISSITTKWINYYVSWVQYLFLHLKEQYNYANNMCITARTMANAVPHTYFFTGSFIFFCFFFVFFLFFFFKKKQPMGT